MKRAQLHLGIKSRHRHRNGIDCELWRKMFNGRSHAAGMSRHTFEGNGVTRLGTGTPNDMETESNEFAAGKLVERALSRRAACASHTQKVRRGEPNDVRLIRTVAFAE